MAGSISATRRRKFLDYFAADADHRSAADRTPRDGDMADHADSSPRGSAGQLSGTFWELMAELSEADRWRYRYDTKTGELYVEDAQTLKRYFSQTQ